MRNVVLTVALLFVALLAYLSVRVLIEHGVHDFGGLLLAAASLVVLLLLVVGIVGALRHPPDK